MCLQGLSSTSGLSSPDLMLAGGLGGTAFWLACFPLDTVKCKLQVDSYSKPQYHGMLDCARQVCSVWSFLLSPLQLCHNPTWHASVGSPEEAVECPPVDSRRASSIACKLMRLLAACPEAQQVPAYSHACTFHAVLVLLRADRCSRWAQGLVAGLCTSTREELPG